MDYSLLLKLRYRGKSDLTTSLERANVLGYTANQITSEMAYLFIEILNQEPCSYWNDDVRICTINFLESQLSNAPEAVKFDYAMLEHFIIGYHTYLQTTEIIKDLSKLNINQEIKNRMYRIPTYISLVEGCITNLFRFIALVLDSVSIQDYKRQKKLGPLCEVLSSNGLSKLTQYIDVDIRNAINHGGVMMLKSGHDLMFSFTKNRVVAEKTIKFYEFDETINKVYDTVSGILLAIAQFINNHIDLIDVDRNENSFVAFNLLSMQLSVPGIKCTNINDVSDSKQLNLILDTDNTDRTFLIQSALEIAAQVYSVYPNYEQYFFSFENPRMLMAWIRFKNFEISNMISQKTEIVDVVKAAMSRQDVNISLPSTEKISLYEARYFIFPNYHDEYISINKVEDASVEDRKRLKAHLFIGEVEEKHVIVEQIEKAVNWIKALKNPPSPKTPVKHGDMDADSVYINVYKKDSRKSKEIYSNNANFVCIVDYNIDGKTVLKEGGILPRIWNSLYHENIGNYQISWRDKKYSAKKVGPNELCPCGSGKKYKRCCRD